MSIPGNNFEASEPNAEFRTLSEDEMTYLLALRRRHAKELQSRKGVYKVDFGYRWTGGKLTGEVGLRVHVKEKVPAMQLEDEEVVPSEIEGFPVDVIQSNIEDQRRTRRDPLVGGVETRNASRNSLGTLGAVVFDANDRQPMALSNHHVYVGSRPNGAVGDNANQPGTATARDRIGTVTRSNRALDCAVVTLNNNRTPSTTIVDFPGGIKGVVAPRIGMRVTKSGRTTGTTFGMIEGVSINEFTVVPIPGQWQELSRGGDSGSIWLETSSHAAVGLHYGGEVSTAPEDERAWAKRITRVASRLDINLRQKATLADHSTNGPAITTMGDKLLLGWVGTRNLRLNFMSSTDGLNFSNKVTLNDVSPDALALTTFKGRYIVSWIGVGNRRLNIMQSSNGRTWTNKVILGDTSLSSPALAVFKGRLYLAWRGVGNNRLNVMRSNDGKTWSSKRTLGDTTTSGPALAAHNNELLLGWRGVGNNRLNVLKSSNGTTFTNKVTLRDTTISKPAFAVVGDTIYYAWQGVGNRRLNVLHSDDGARWTRKITLRETCIDGPVVGSLGDLFVWSWTGTDRRHRLNTLIYDL